MTCEGKVAVVTGAAGSGMGRSIALTLARERAAVVVNYRTSHEQANQVVDHIREQGGSAVAVQADVFSAEGCQALVEATIAQLGRVDICVISPGSGWHPASPDQLAAAEALEDITHEVAPCLHLLPLVLPAMYERAWGRIIAITTNPHLPSPAYAYNVAKAARAEVMLQAQNAAWQHNVTVNVVAPGPVDPIAGFEAAVEQCEHGPTWGQRKTASPQDVAEGVAFLCSEAGRFITGGTLPFHFRG